MARKKRVRPPKNLQPEQEKISEREVYDVLTFAKSMISGTVYTPELVNARMKDLTLNPTEPTNDMLDTALKDPKNNEDNFRAISEWFEMTDMLYKRNLYYYGNMLSFDLTWTCTNIKKYEEYNSAAYKKDLAILYDFLDKFDSKFEFNRAVRQMTRQDAYFVALRDEGERYTLQELPIKYCKITGKSRDDASYLFDFDLMYFIRNIAVDINTYPKVFRNKYRKRIEDGKNNGYIPSSSTNNRNGEWVYWVQTSPVDNMWCFKFNMEEATQLPYFTPLFKDLILTPIVRNLQTNKYIIAASRMLVGLIPLLKDNKSGNSRNKMAIDPVTLGQFASVVKQGLPNPVSLGVVPFDDMKEFDFSKAQETNIYREHNLNIGINTGSRMSYPAQQQNAIESQSSLDVDKMMVEYLYPQFNHFLNYYVNKRTKKYKFNFFFEGFKFNSDRQNRIDTAMKMASVGITSFPKIAAAWGMLPQDLQRQMAESSMMGWIDNLVPLLNMYNQSQDQGRPQNQQINNDNTLKSRETGSNVQKGGKI
jgi:hypothetical protein